MIAIYDYLCDYVELEVVLDDGKLIYFLSHRL